MKRNKFYSGRNIVLGIKGQQENERQTTYFQRQYCTTEDFIYRLGLFGELHGHNGCVNCLQWNEKGTLLASGSDDFRLILWDPFAKRKLHAIHSGHVNNIFSVQFMPETNDRLLATGAGDGKVRVHDMQRATSSSSTPQQPPPSSSHIYDDCVRSFHCHFARVKRVVTHRSEPNIIWSGGEDGLVMQFDLREPATCRTICTHGLINLNAHLGPDAEIKCLALNPARPEMIAVGANDYYVRIYDRRMIAPKETKLRSDEDRVIWDRSAVMSLSLDNVDYSFPTSSVQYYIAGHLPVKQTDIRRRYRPLTSTYITFSPCGRDLLVNLGGEQIYLFDLTERRRSLLGEFRKYFDSFLSEEDGRTFSTANGLHYANGLHQSALSAVYNGHYVTSNGRNGVNANFKLARLVQSLSNSDFMSQSTKKRYQLPPRAQILKQKANVYFEKENYTMAVAYYSEAICLAPRSPVLYSNRAAAYLKRQWDGDIYAAFRDCYVTLQVEPDNLKAHFRLVKCLYDLKQYKSAEKCLEMFQARYPDQAKSHTCIELANEIHSAIFENQENHSPKRKRTRSRSVAAEDLLPAAENSDGFATDSAASQPSSRALSGFMSGDDGSRQAPSAAADANSNLPRISLRITSSDALNLRNRDVAVEDASAAGAAAAAASNFLSTQELAFRETAFDYDLRFCGHCNTTTDIKEANFFGCNGEYIVGGSDDGKFFIWDRKTCNIVRVIVGDESIVNCLQPHPSQCMLASSGIDNTVKLWAPRPEDGSPDPRDVPDQSNAALANQRRMNADPLEVMLMNMGYRLSGLMEPASGRHDVGANPAVQCHPS